MTYYLAVLLVLINIAGISLKIYTSRRLKAMEGVSDIYTSDISNSNIIGRL